MEHPMFVLACVRAARDINSLAEMVLEDDGEGGVLAVADPRLRERFFATTATRICEELQKHARVVLNRADPDQLELPFEPTGVSG